MTSDEQKALVFEIIDRLFGSWWTVVAGVCVGAAVALVALKNTDEIFAAQAAIKADVDNLPREFVQRTVSDDLEIRLPDLRHAVLSDENMHEVIVTLFREQESPELEQELADRIRSRVGLTFAKVTRSGSTINVSYWDYQAERAADVTNMLAEFFVVANKQLRSESATDVRESLEGLTADIERELKQLKQEQSRLLAAHPNELESQRVPNEDALRALQKQHEELEKSVSAAQRRVKVEEAELARRRDEGPARGVPKATPETYTDPRVQQLEKEISELLLRVTEDHPDVQKKRREIERIRSAEVAAPKPNDEPVVAAPTVPGLDIWETRLEASRLELERLQGEEAKLRDEIAKRQRYLGNTPAVQQRLSDLATRIGVLEQTYAENQRKVNAARSGEQLEQEDIANPFVITGFAAPSFEPVWPDRMTFLAAGIAGGLLLFVGPVLARVLLRPTIMSESALRAMTDLPVLATIPVLATPRVAKERAASMRKNFGLSFLSTIVLCCVVALWRLNLL